MTPAQLDTAADIAHHLGGIFTSFYAPGHPDYPGAYILLPGQLFSLRIAPDWKDKTKGTAAAYLLPDHPRDCPRRIHTAPSPAFSWSRPAAAIAADLQRRLVQPTRAEHASKARATIQQQRSAAAGRASARDTLARLFRADKLETYNGTLHGPRFRLPEYQLDTIASHDPAATLRMEIELPLAALPLIAAIIAQPQPH
jgi:hypothetical protein